MLQLHKKRDKMVLIKEPYCIINSKHKLSVLENKLLAILVTKIRDTDEKFTEYEITIKELQNILNIEYGESYNYLKQKILKLMDIKIILEDENEWKPFHILVEPTIKKKSGILKFYFSPSFHTLIKASKHYLTYSVEILIYLNSKYSLRLYKLLKDKYENKKKYNNDKPIIFKVEELKELLRLPPSYKYKDIKRRVLITAKEEINKYTDIKIDFIEHKKGRKVDEIEFIVSNNPNSLIPSKMNNTKTVNKKQPGKTNKSVKSDNFVTDLRKKLNNTDNLILLGEDLYKIKDNLLYKNDTLLDKNKALEEYKHLEENKDKLKITTLTELKEDNKNKIKEKLISIYKNKTLKGLPVKINGEIQYINAVLLDIEDFTDIDNFTVLLQSGEKIFKMKMSLESLKNYFK